VTLPFAADYAAAYDLIYADKGYEQEVELLERIFATYGQGPVRSVLDLGCGTGSHAIPLAQRGHTVVGVDRSSAMLDQARARARLPCPTLTFEQGDLRQLELTRSFDAVLMMFAVLGYQLENADVVAALASAGRHTRPGGLLVFDVWYGPAVLTERPAPRVKVSELPHGQLVRVANGELDARHHACHVSYRVWRIEDQRLTGETRERHTVRYFFPLELELLLGQAGFELLRLGGFPQLEHEPDTSTWNVCVVARRAPA
jgi:SAM-dependent methyltransferase